MLKDGLKLQFQPGTLIFVTKSNLKIAANNEELPSGLATPHTASTYGIFGKQNWFCNEVCNGKEIWNSDRSKIDTIDKYDGLESKMNDPKANLWICCDESMLCFFGIALPIYNNFDKEYQELTDESILDATKIFKLLNDMNNNNNSQIRDSVSLRITSDMINNLPKLKSLFDRILATICNIYCGLIWLYYNNIHILHLYKANKFKHGQNMHILGSFKFSDWERRMKFGLFKYAEAKYNTKPQNLLSLLAFVGPDSLDLTGIDILKSDKQTRKLFEEEPATVEIDGNILAYIKFILTTGYHSLPAWHKVGILISESIIVNMDQDQLHNKFKNMKREDYHSCRTKDGIIANLKIMGAATLYDGSLIEDYPFDFENELYIVEWNGMRKYANILIKFLNAMELITLGKTIRILAVTMNFPKNPKWEKQQFMDIKLGREHRLNDEINDWYLHGFKWRPKNWKSTPLSYVPIGSKRSDIFPQLQEFAKKHGYDINTTIVKPRILDDHYKQVLGMDFDDPSTITLWQDIKIDITLKGNESKTGWAGEITFCKQNNMDINWRDCILWDEITIDKKTIIDIEPLLQCLEGTKELECDIFDAKLAIFAALFPQSEITHFLSNDYFFDSKNKMYKYKYDENGNGYFYIRTQNGKFTKLDAKKNRILKLHGKKGILRRWYARSVGFDGLCVEDNLCVDDNGHLCKTFGISNDNTKANIGYFLDATSNKWTKTIEVDMLEAAEFQLLDAPLRRGFKHNGKIKYKDYGVLGNPLKKDDVIHYNTDNLELSLYIYIYIYIICC